MRTHVKTKTRLRGRTGLTRGHLDYPSLRKRKVKGPDKARMDVKKTV